MIKRWEVLNKSEVISQEETRSPRLAANAASIVETLLKNRNITDREIFFNPPSASQLINQSANHFPDLDQKQLDRAVSRIQGAIEKREKIIVWGDYDVDGVCAAAVLWQTLYGLGANVLPHIPDRFEEGYGLGSERIKKLVEEGCQLIITVDSGITAVEEADFIQELGADLIITDHHLKPDKLPEAYAIIHTTALCGTGIAWLLASKLSPKPHTLDPSLDLVAIATIADLQPLLGANRALARTGFEVLNKLERPGLSALADIAGLKPGTLGSYAAGWVFGPRINAVGRLKHGIEALRLLCTTDPTRAHQLAQVLNRVNTERQELTVHTFDHAKGLVEGEEGLIVIHHDSWHEGIIGLVAGKIVEEYGRPAIVISQGKDFSKGSARSVNGLNIVDVLRGAGKLLEEFIKTVRKNADPELSKLDPRPVLKIDFPLPLEMIDSGLVKELQDFSPHGVDNPEPVFLAEGATVLQVKKVGRGKNHLKLGVAPGFEVLWFNATQPLARGQTIDFAYTPQIESWQGKESITLKARDVKLSHSSGMLGSA